MRRVVLTIKVDSARVMVVIKDHESAGVVVGVQV